MAQCRGPANFLGELLGARRSGLAGDDDTEVSVEGQAGTVALPLDRLGQFIAAVPGPRLRFLLSAAASARRIVTPWIFR